MDDAAIKALYIALEVPANLSQCVAGWLFDKKRIFVTTGMKGDLNGIRVTPQIYTTKQELDRLVATLLEAADHGIG